MFRSRSPRGIRVYQRSPAILAVRKQMSSLPGPVQPIERQRASAMGAPAAVAIR